MGGVRGTFSSMLLLLAICLAGLYGLHAAGLDAVSTNGTRFVDGEGRTLILRGFNLAADAKVPDYRPIKDLTILHDLKRFGVNVVRHLFIWEAYERVRGEYDASYLEYYLSVVDHLAQQGIYTIADIHQDAYSRFNLGGCGDGFPRWALPASFLPAPPDNSRQNCSRWGPRLVNDQETKMVFEAFYNNEGGVRDRYLSLVEHLAGVFVSRPSVIGLDLLNEPLGDEVLHVSPLYAEAALRVRQVNPRVLILQTPHFLVGSGFKATRLLQPTVAHAVFSPHFYNFVNLLPSAYDFGMFTRFVLRQLLAKSTEWNVPFFLGEFGAFYGRFADRFAADMYAFLDANFLSGAQWSYTTNWSPEKKDGWNGEDLSVVAGGRTRSFPFMPSPRRISGTPLSSHSVPRVSYQLTWRSSGATSALCAELYVPRVEFCGTQELPHVEASFPVECKFMDEYTLACHGTTESDSVHTLQLTCAMASTSFPNVPLDSPRSRESKDYI